MFLETNVTFSLEFFPPKTETAKESLWHTISAFIPFKPSFVTVTYGALGAQRELTHDIIHQIHHKTPLKTTAHITCIDAKKFEIDTLARIYWNNGIKNLVAVRGDPLEGLGYKYKPNKDGYAYAIDLIKGLLNIAPFDITVSAYPECHPEAISPESDLYNLKNKLDAGAKRAITQYFFDNELFYEFFNQTQKIGITSPIIPGLMPIHNFARIRDFSKKCGSSIPKKFYMLFRNDNQKDHLKIAHDLLLEQCSDLIKNGITHFHFYSLNKSDIIVDILKNFSSNQKQNKIITS